MGWTASTRARAKINLTLHIRGRLENGYHDLESLVAFADIGDDVSLVAGEHLSLTMSGPEADGLSATSDNHILKAVEALRSLKPDIRVGHFHLVKRLPIASGIGGGSTDAAAALRLVAKLNSISLDDPALTQAALMTGADVPVCLQSRTRMMRGIGDDLSAPLMLPSLFAVLVNPRIVTPTPDVFKAIGLLPGERRTASQHDGIPHEATSAIVTALLARHGNDMEAAAIRLVPQIADVKSVLQETAPRLIRMSGSGATVFAIYPDCRSAAQAAKVVRKCRPHWWVRPTQIR
jgi:4-diphosphocytidyl-2-C-methyl-D-erythritol kinase